MRKSLISLLSTGTLLFASAILGQVQVSLFSRNSLRSLVQETLRGARELYFVHKANYGKGDLWAFHQLAVGLAEAGCFTEAIWVLKAMPKPTGTFAQSQFWDAHRQVAEIAAKKGRYDLAKQLAMQIPNFTGFAKEREGAMKKSAIIEALAQSLEKLPPSKAQRRLKEAISIAQQISDNFRRGKAFSALAKAAVKFALQEAKVLSSQVLAIAEKCQNNQRLHLLVSVAPVINHWDGQKAKQIFDRAMKIALRQPQKHYQRERSIWWVIQGMIEANLWDDAIKATNLLPETEPKLPSDIPTGIVKMVELPPTKWGALKVIAEKLAERKLFAKALQVADTIREPCYRAGAYVSIAKFVAKSEPQKALQLIRLAMDIATKEVDLRLHSHLLTTVIETASTFAPQEVSKLALEAAKSLQRIDNYSASQSLSSLAAKVAGLDIRTAQKLFAMAVNIAKGVAKPEQKMLALEGIVQQMCRARFFNEAQKLLPEIEQASLARGNVSPGRWCLSMRQIIMAMAEAGQAKQALALLPKLNSCRVEDQVEATIAVAKSLASSDIRYAEKLLRNALQIARAKWREYEARKRQLAQLHVSGVYPPYDAFNMSLKVTLTVAQIVNR